MSIVAKFGNESTDSITQRLSYAVGFKEVGVDTHILPRSQSR